MGDAPNRDQLLDNIRRLLEAGQVTALAPLLRGTHAADVADLLERLDDEQRVILFGQLDDEVAGSVLVETGPETRGLLLRETDSARLSHLLELLPPDDAVFLLEGLPDEEAEQIVSLMRHPEADNVEELLRYEEGRAGRLMTEQFVAIPEHLTAQATIDLLRRKDPRTESFYHLYAVDEAGHLAGVISLRELLMAAPDQRVSDFMTREVIAVDVDTDQEEVADTIAKYDFLAIPVVDRQGRLAGVITVDDVIDVLEEEAAEDLLRFGGTFEEVSTVHSIREMWLLRLPWLIIAIAGQMVTANVIMGFQATLEQVLALAFFIPVIMATAGNAGTQSLAAMVRSLAIGEVGPEDVAKIVFREARVGLLLGIVCGLITGLIAHVWQGDFTLGIVVGLALAGALTVAAVSGATVPLIFKALDRDPAYASGPFITTLNDVISLTIYFLLATILLMRAG